MPLKKNEMSRFVNQSDTFHIWMSNGVAMPPPPNLDFRTASSLVLRVDFGICGWRNWERSHKSCDRQSQLTLHATLHPWKAGKWPMIMTWITRSLFPRTVVNVEHEHSLKNLIPTLNCSWWNEKSRLTSNSDDLEAVDSFRFTTTAKVNQ